MEAEYRSKCAVCGEWINPGDKIEWLHDDDGEYGDWVHQECFDDENDPS